jgi:hypothetical protein
MGPLPCWLGGGARAPGSYAYVQLATLNGKDHREISIFSKKVGCGVTVGGTIIILWSIWHSSWVLGRETETEIRIFTNQIFRFVEKR